MIESTLNHEIRHTCIIGIEYTGSLFCMITIAATICSKRDVCRKDTGREKMSFNDIIND